MIVPESSLFLYRSKLLIDLHIETKIAISIVIIIKIFWVLTFICSDTLIVLNLIMYLYLIF